MAVVQVAGRVQQIVLKSTPLVITWMCLVAAWLLVRISIRASWFLLKHPRLTLAGITVIVLPLTALLLVLSTATAAGALLWWKRRNLFVRFVQLPALSFWQTLRLYRPGWAATMATCQLTVAVGETTAAPVLKEVVCTEATDRLIVQMLRGQTPEDFQAAAERIAYSFGARTARVYAQRPDAMPIRVGRFAWLLKHVDAWKWADRPSRVHIVIARKDPLTAIVRPFPISENVDLTALPLALTSSLDVYRFRLLATHLLVAGASRRGKGSVIWSLIRAVAPAVKSGLVRLWVIDPKGGMELAFGRPMFTRFAHQSFEEMADLLDEAVTEMQLRQLRLAGKVRVHTPTTTDPLVLLVIDEIAALTSYLKDAELRKRIDAALGLLLSQGAAVGVVVVGAVQDPRKETMSARDLFLSRIVLGVTDASHVDMVLGDGARKAGAAADKLDVSAKGVGFVMVDGTPEPIKVRFTYLDDTEIKRMAAAFPAPASSTPSITNPERVFSGEVIPASLMSALNGAGDRDE